MPTDRNLYRFVHENKILYVNFFESPTKYWEKEIFDKVSKIVKKVKIIFKIFFKIM